MLILGCSILTLSHCRMVGDRLNGIDAGLFKRDKECRQACQDDFQARNKAESTLHSERVRACAGDPACIAEEQTRHLAALESSRAQREACLSGCHHQGGGTIGS
jgi:hypothetical protein